MNISLLNNLDGYNQLVSLLERGSTPISLCGVSHIHKAHLAASVYQQFGRPLLVLCGDETAAQKLAYDMEQFLQAKVHTLFERDFVYYRADSISHEYEHQRLSSLYAIASSKAPVIIATISGALAYTIPKSLLKSAAFKLKMGDSYDLDELITKLATSGYTRAEMVEGSGQFCVRGGIIDIFSPGERHPIRADFFGDALDSLGLFDVKTQRRINNLQKATVLPCSEALVASAGRDKLAKELGAVAAKLKNNDQLAQNILADIEILDSGAGFFPADKYLSYIYPEPATLFDYLDDSAMVMLDDSHNVFSHAKGYIDRMCQDIEHLMENGQIYGKTAKNWLDLPALDRKLLEKQLVMLETFLPSKYHLPIRAILNITAKQLPFYGASLETAVADISHYNQNGYMVYLLCSTPKKAEKLGELLRQQNIPNRVDLHMTQPPQPGVTVAIGTISAGFEYPHIKLAVIAEGQLVKGTEVKKKTKKSKREQISDLDDLTIGSFVVHEHHGIGRFCGIAKMQVDGAEKDYIKLSYAGTDTLYVPATQLDLVSKYIGAAIDSPVKINKLGGTEWVRAKQKAKAAAKELAGKLIEIYAKRQRAKGYKFNPDNEWQREFETNFEYEETEDQLKCVEEIKADMCSTVPMDRLLCGDVGFGKTEVAFRAVMKCVLEGKQAALLVPTTVLAHQHFLTAKQRFGKYPIKIEMLSRFVTPKKQSLILKRLASGQIDLVIGTHKLLQQKVEFKDLGLLVIDEEQRFGVAQKENIKELTAAVDVLTLTATPIPRTLNMALSGIRDMSVIEEPPRDRYPVSTYVMEYNPTVINDAIRRELAREGQVYYLHNRVESIDSTAARLQHTFPDFTVGVVHAKMTEDQISKVMGAVMNGDIDILVCTTIIESGIDISNVNTIIIEDSDRLGLAQLHQIRGRVGRSGRHAYAYLTYKTGKVLTEVQTKRLTAIREFAEFGSGFKIALRDMEIRGAGNVLGAEQSGHMLSVGYDMYLKLLDEAVVEEKGQTMVRTVSCTADFSVNANIPESYVAVLGQRMDLYRKIAYLTDREDKLDFVDELCDRYGEPPKSVLALIDIALIRAAAARVSINEIAQKDGNIIFKFVSPDFQRISGLCGLPEHKGRILINASDAPYLSYKIKQGEDVLTLTKRFLESFEGV